MPKSFRKKSPSALRQALRTIEKIVGINNPDEKNIPMNHIYKIAHAHIGDCDNPHFDWVKEAETLGKELKDY